MIRFGLPRGRLAPQSDRFCDALGVRVKPGVLSYQTRADGHEVSVLLLKAPDVARLLRRNMLDLGLTGDEWLMETGADPGCRCFEARCYLASVCLLMACGDQRPLGAHPVCRHALSQPGPAAAGQHRPSLGDHPGQRQQRGSRSRHRRCLRRPGRDGSQRRAELAGDPSVLRTGNDAPGQVPGQRPTHGRTSRRHARANARTGAMTLRVRAGRIAPDIRFGAADALADPAGVVVVGDVTIRAESCLPSLPFIPRYLRYADREAVLVTEGVASPGEFESYLMERVHALADSRGSQDLGAAVIVLDAVDRCFREAGLWPGNIYLAGPGALRAVVDLVGEDPDLLPRDAELVLRELAALELAYLFPVAGKFRAGAYDSQIQYRLNGWGRALAGRLTARRSGAARADLYRRAMAEHVGRECQRYRSFLGELDVGRQDYHGNKLDAARELPIPVLV